MKLSMMNGLAVFLLLPNLVLADADITLSGEYVTDQEIEVTSDTTIHLDGVTFTDCTLKLRGDQTITLDLVEDTVNVFMMENSNQEPLKATKNTNIRIAGRGKLEVTSLKRITDSGKPSGVLVCNNLTVTDGDVTVTFDNNKSDTACILLKGDYLQTGGRVKVDASKKNCTNEFVGVQMSANSVFSLLDGKFRAEIAGTKSRAIDLKSTGSALFAGGDVKCEFEGPQGRFVNGGTLLFEGGEYLFTTNVTSKMTADFMPVDLRAVKADISITIAGGSFRADLPLGNSMFLATEDDPGTFIDIQGGTFSFVAAANGSFPLKTIGALMLTGPAQFEVDLTAYVEKDETLPLMTFDAFEGDLAKAVLSVTRGSRHPKSYKLVQEANMIGLKRYRRGLVIAVY